MFGIWKVLNLIVGIVWLLFSVIVGVFVINNYFLIYLCNCCKLVLKICLIVIGLWWLKNWLMFWLSLVIVDIFVVVNLKLKIVIFLVICLGCIDFGIIVILCCNS